MPSRRGLDDVAQVPRRAPGRRGVPQQTDVRSDHLGLDYGERLRLNDIASGDCAQRVADVLNKLGYGFDVIPSNSSGPKRA